MSDFTPEQVLMQIEDSEPVFYGEPVVRSNRPAAAFLLERATRVLSVRGAGSYVSGPPTVKND
jgi:hypothetical protein